jgi:hypothetical protein
LNRLRVWGLRTGRNKLPTFANSISGKINPDKPGLVKEFIVEIEGPPKNCDVTGVGPVPSTPPPALSCLSTFPPLSALWTNPGNPATSARPTELSAATASNPGT